MLALGLGLGLASGAACTRTPPPSSANARKTLLAALRTTQAKKARTQATLRGMTAGGHSFESIVDTELVPPDRRRSRMRLPGGVSREVVVIGPRAWGRGSDEAPWEPVAAAARSVAPRIEKSLELGIARGTARVVQNGPAELDGRQTTEYSVSGPLPGAEPGMTEARVWVLAEGLVHRCEAEAHGAATTRLEETWDYDESLSIEPPGP